MKAVVTGGCGFVGSAVVLELLNRGTDVLVIDNLHHGAASFKPPADARFIEHDIGLIEPEHLEGYSEACWIHLAALPFIPDSFRDPVSIFNTNTVGTLRAIQVAKLTGASRFVLVSTSEVYRSSERVLLSEVSALDPLSPYASSKLAAEVLLRTQRIETPPYVILRLFNAYGPRYTYPYFIPDLIQQCLCEPILNVGSLGTSRDFTHVTDSACGIVQAATRDEALGEIFNLGSGTQRSMAQVLDLIRQLTNAQGKPVRNDPLRSRPTGRDPVMLVANNSKAARILGWRPRIEFELGIEETIQYTRLRLADSINQKEQHVKWHY